MNNVLLVTAFLVGSVSAHASLKCEKLAKVAAFRYVAEDALTSGGEVKPMSVSATDVEAFPNDLPDGQVGRLVTVETEEVNDSYRINVQVILNSNDCEVISVEVPGGVD